MCARLLLEGALYAMGDFYSFNGVVMQAGQDRPHHSGIGGSFAAIEGYYPYVMGHLGDNLWLDTSTFDSVTTACSVWGRLHRCVHWR